MNLLVQLFICLLAILQPAIAQENIIDVPPGGLVVTAGQPVTITWSNPSSGTVTIKLLQASAVTPTSGTVVATGIPASSETATFTIPAANEVNSAPYIFEIIDDTDPNNYNFSPQFNIIGAVGTSSATSVSSSTPSVALPSSKSGIISSSATSESAISPTSSISSSTGIPSSPFSSRPSGTSSRSGGISAGVIAGVAVGCGIVGFLLCAAIFFGIRRMRLQGRREAQEVGASAIGRMGTAQKPAERTSELPGNHEWARSPAAAELEAREHRGELHDTSTSRHGLGNSKG